MDARKRTIEVPASQGEMLDTIVIHEIKEWRTTDPDKRALSRYELPMPRAGCREFGLGSKRAFFAELRDRNGRLWDFEDAIRGCEAERGFDGRLVELAQVAYRPNYRCALKTR